jgi:DNA processing protein
MTQLPLDRFLETIAAHGAWPDGEAARRDITTFWGALPRASREAFLREHGLSFDPDRARLRLVGTDVLVEGPDDVLAALGLPAGPPFDRATRQAVVSGDGAEVLRVLTHGPATVDEIVARSGLPADRVVSALLRLELSGVVDPPVGQVYGARHNIRRTG